MFCLATSAIPASAQASSETVSIDTRGPAHPFPHFWEQTFGSGRAILTMRESYRSDLREVKKATDLQYVRFHNILHDEVGVYDEDEQGRPVYNFSYVDQIYDGLLENGVRPFVEISFMPKKLALRQDIHSFWYHPIVSPPKSYEKWDDLIRAFAGHLVDRYGIDEVTRWYFEVWNEPNIDFWTGEPKETTYYELYDHTARALKSVNSHLRVGGPSTRRRSGSSHLFNTPRTTTFPSTLFPPTPTRTTRSKIFSNEQDIRWTIASVAPSPKCATKSRRLLNPRLPAYVDGVECSLA